MSDEPSYGYLERPTWTVRRRVVLLSLLFIAINIEFIIIRGTDSALYAQMGLGLLAAGVSIIGAYVFGAAYSDNAFNNSLALLQRGLDGIQVKQDRPNLVAVPIKKATVITTDSSQAVADNPVPPNRDEEN